MNQKKKKNAVALHTNYEIHFKRQMLSFGQQQQPVAQHPEQ